MTLGLILITLALVGIAFGTVARAGRRHAERRLLALLTEAPRTGFDLCTELNLAPHETFALLGHLEHHGLVGSEPLPRFRGQHHVDRVFHVRRRAA